MIRLFFLLAVSACVVAQDLTGPVVRVIDGDTIEVELAGERERVRYIGIDTPEMNDRRPAVRELAAAATRANARLVGGRKVRLELDVAKRDRYGRLLAYVWVGDTMVNEALVRSGHARPGTYPPNVRYTERLFEAARQVREARTADAPKDGSRAPAGSIAASDAAAHVDEIATVCDSVGSTRYLARGRRPTFLNLGRPHPDQDLTVVIWGEDRAKFPGAPEDRYRGARICVTGRIELYRGKPQIIAREAGMLRVWE